MTWEDNELNLHNRIYIQFCCYIKECGARNANRTNGRSERENKNKPFLFLTWRTTGKVTFNAELEKTR
jgi:hypothetical protein